MAIFTNIRIVSKYETKLLVRGWFFKVFAFLALFALGKIFVKSAVEFMMNNSSSENQTKGDYSGD